MSTAASRGSCSASHRANPEQIERLGPPGARRVAAIGKVAEVVVAQPQILRVPRRTGHHPAVITPLDPKPHRHSHETRIPPTTHRRQIPPLCPRRVATPHGEGLAGKRRHHLHLLGGRRRRRVGRPAARTRDRRRSRQSGRGRAASVRQVHGPPRRPAPGGDRNGGHPRRNPGALLDLSR